MALEVGAVAAADHTREAVPKAEADTSQQVEQRRVATANLDAEAVVVAVEASEVIVAEDAEDEATRVGVKALPLRQLEASLRTDAEPDSLTGR